MTCVVTHRAWLLPLCGLAMACQDDAAQVATSAAAPKSAAAAPPTNRIDIPATVRSNLGIVFAKVEEREVARTLRLAGHFAPPPTSVRVVHAPLAGAVTYRVGHLDAVKKGQVLALVRSPLLRERQEGIHRAEHEIRRARDTIRLRQAELAATRRAAAFASKRLARIAKTGARRASLEQRLVDLRSQRRIQQRRLARVRSELARARHHREIQLRALADITGLSVTELTSRKEPKGADDHAAHGAGLSPLWDRLDAVTLRAPIDGVIATIEARAGDWLRRGAAVLEVRDPTALRFEGAALQSDLGRLRDGARVVVVNRAPRGRRGEGGQPPRRVTGRLRLGVAGSLKGRVIPAYVTLDRAPAWARDGLSAVAEVVVAGASSPELALPLEAVVRDGLEEVFFRRDPRDPNKVIRVTAELGVDDGRWVTVFSGVNVGDEVVTHGAYELKLASGGRSGVKGHFHPDGSFHAEPEGK